MRFWWNEAEYQQCRKKGFSILAASFMALTVPTHLAVGLAIAYLVIVYL